MLWSIMTEPRSKAEKLSKTCISYLEERVKEKVYLRSKDLSSVEAIAKGIECENEAIFVLNKALGTDYKKTVYKDGEKMENDRCTGHEDIDWWDHTIDTKVSNTFDSYPIFEEEADKMYYRQWQAYMRLKWEKYKKHTIAKVLVNTPKRMIEKRLYWIYDELVKKYEENMQFVDLEYAPKAKQLFMQHVFDKQLSINADWTILQLSDEEVIPYEKRVHLTVIERDDKAIDMIKKRVKECRDYLQLLWY